MNATAEMQWRSPLTEASVPQKPGLKLPRSAFVENHRVCEIEVQAFEPTEVASCAFQCRTAWRMRQVPKLFPYGRRYGRDLR
jgi:hypothetical protein